MKTLIVTLLLSSSMAQAARFVVEAKRPLTQAELKATGLKIETFASKKSAYFSRLYAVTAASSEQLKALSWVKKVEQTSNLNRMSLLPSENPRMITADELFPYQWGLLNQGQTYIREKDDIHNLPMVGVEGKDTNWEKIKDAIPAGRPIVAVLDSGVDLDHPEIKANLWKNEAECGKDPKVDNDKNQYAGDCNGWNFTEAKDSAEAKVPQDLDGHGTHVAGIIAASKNDSGIVGVNPNALIMPIKVMKDASTKADIAPSEAFARGILYAVDNGAHIINLSLGWPKSLETTYLKNAIDYAIKNNVIIIAAAGNNNSSEQIYPCAYPGVICTAASTLNGKFAGFSNFGGHVDAIAPGEGILSLNPTILEPEFFSVTGYDVKSGTSQAAPMLAGMVSILKAQEPRLTIGEVYARLYLAPRNADKTKFINGGDLSWDVLARKIDVPVIRPVLKLVQRLVLAGERTETNFVVPVRNYGLPGSDVSVAVESLSAGLEVISTAQNSLTFNTDEQKNIPFQVKINSLSMEATVRVKIIITDVTGEQSFITEFPIVRDITGEAKFKKHTFAFKKDALPMGNVVQGRLNSYLSTLETYGKSTRQEYFLRRSVKDSKKLELTVFTRQGQQLVEGPKAMVVDGFVSLVNFLKVDLNLDGKEDYLVESVLEDAKGDKYIGFHFFSDKMEILWPKFHAVKVKLDQKIASLNDLNFTRMDHATLGKILVPVVFTEGQMPKLDQEQDFYGRWDGSTKDRLFYLEPMVETSEFRIRALTSQAWVKNLKTELQTKWYETVEVENVLPISSSDAQKGEVRAVVSVGQGTMRKTYIATFDTKKTLRGNALPQIVLQTSDIDTVYSVTPAGLEATGEAYLNVYDRTRAKVVTTKNAEQSSQLNYVHEAETDLITGHIASFEKGQERLSIIQTRDELISLSTINGKVVKTSRPKLRYSFFSAKVLSEMYNPIIYKRGEEQAPGLYVDSTAITGNRINVFEEQNGKLVSSVRNSILVPLKESIACKALNPAYSANSGAHEFVFLCLENKEWFIRTYEMN